MDIEKMLKEAYMSGVIEAQIGEQVPNMSFDFDGMANAYAKSKVKELNIQNVSNRCRRCGDSMDECMCNEYADEIN
jgi:hypothetical protein